MAFFPPRVYAACVWSKTHSPCELTFNTRQERNPNVHYAYLPYTCEYLKYNALVICLRERTEMGSFVNRGNAEWIVYCPLQMRKPGSENKTFRMHVLPLFHKVTLMSAEK